MPRLGIIDEFFRSAQSVCVDMVQVCERERNIFGVA